MAKTPLFNNPNPPEPAINWDLLGPSLGRYQLVEKLTGFPTTLSWSELHRTYRVFDTVSRREGRMFVTTSAYLSDLLRQTIPAIAGLSHPGLENIWEVGQSGIYTYFVSPPEYGQRLSEIPAQSFNLKTAANIVNDLAAILTYLHQRNFVHGRVTPSEVLLGDRIILKNTGLKQAVEMAEKKWGEDNAEMGVFSFGSKDEVIYRPPEHLLTNDHLLTPRTDQFQLGMLAYSLLVGGDPFPAAEGANDLLISRFTRPIPEPFSHKPDFPGATWTVLQKALSKRPQDRYDSVAEFNQAFQQTIFNG